MTTKAGVGMSHHRNPEVAGREAAEQALERAGAGRPDFVFAFASVGYDQPSLLAAIRKATDGAPLCGSSGEGIIAGAEADESNFSVAVMAISSDELRFDTAIATDLKRDAEAAGRRIGDALRAASGADALGVVMLADGLTLNFDRFLRGFESGGPRDRPWPVFGGTSADNWAMKRTYQYCDDRVVSDGVVCALVSGRARVAWAVNHGCLPIGVERTVTKCLGNVIYEIDGKPILEVLKEYLVGDEIDNWNKTVVNLCLGFKAPGTMKDYDEYLIRFMPTKDDASGSITISTEVTEGTSVWMTRRDFDKIAYGVDRIAQELHAATAGHPPKLVLQFDCAGRGKVVLRDQQKTALQARLRGGFGADVPWMGLYTYGEIGPVGTQNAFHNYTAVVLAIY
jgi:hypothetical protein